MATETLVRMLRYQLNIKRKDMTLVTRQLEQIEKAIKMLDVELEQETQQLTEDHSIMAAYQAYSKKMKLRRAHLDENRKGLENHLNALEEEVVECFAEAKKYEILNEQAHLKIQKSQLKQEQLMLDEVSAVQFVRQKDNA